MIIEFPKIHRKYQAFPIHDLYTRSGTLTGYNNVLLGGKEPILNDKGEYFEPINTKQILHLLWYLSIDIFLIYFVVFKERHFIKLLLHGNLL